MMTQQKFMTGAVLGLISPLSLQHLFHHTASDAPRYANKRTPRTLGMIHVIRDSEFGHALKILKEPHHAIDYTQSGNNQT